MIADMIRVVIGLAAWIAGTAIAVSVASFGANVVLRNAGASPGVPMITGIPPAQAGAPSAATHPPAASAGSSSSPGQPPRTGASAASPSATPTSTDGRLQDYTLAGGRVTLDLTPGSVQLVTAVPDAGYSVQTWSGTGWLRVDFSSGPQVSSLIASWYEHAPSVTVTN
jgi:hypothetical protein